MIEFRHISKKYGSDIGLNDLSLTVRNGEIFGLIGHNGAGKTTTIKTLVSVIAPDQGEIFVDGDALSENRDEIKRKIGYVPDSPDMFLKMTACGYWSFIAAIYGIEENKMNARLDVLVPTFGLSDAENRVIESFSHGMRQKTFIIGALLSEPDIWVLDEPLIGLDPQSAFNLKNMMRSHVAAGHTVLFSTHVLAVAEELCDRIGILRHGELIFVGTMEELRAHHDGDSLESIYLSLVQESEVKGV